MKAPAASSCGSDKTAPTVPCGLGGTSELPTSPVAYGGVIRQCRGPVKRAQMGKRLGKSRNEIYLKTGAGKVLKELKRTKVQFDKQKTNSPVICT